MRTSLPIILLLSVIIILAEATPATVSKVNVAAYSGSFVKAYYENRNPPITGCTAPCLTVDTQTTQPTGTALSPALDGSAVVECAGASTCSASLTTSNANDVIIAEVSAYGSYGAGASCSTLGVSGVSGAGLTWTQRGSTYCQNNGAMGDDIAVFYAIASSALTSASVTATLTGGSGSYTDINLFGVSGANTNSPWDSNPGLPGTCTTTSGTPTCSISTSYANDMIVGFSDSGENGHAEGSGYSRIVNFNSYRIQEYRLVSTTQTNLAVTMTGSTSFTIEWADAVQGVNSYSIPSGSSAYLWSPQFASATTIASGTWAFDFWGAATSNNYVPITLTNSQTAATPTGFQEQISMNPSTYTSYEASDLGNVRFCADVACNSQLYSWLESCASSPCGTATSAVFWVNLGSNTISANGGTLVIYMVFLPASVEFDGVHAGEIPTLSTTYAQYDNGANVFSLYFNGNTPTSSFVAFTGYTLSQVPGVAYGSGTANVIRVTGSATTNDAQFAYGTGVPNAGYVEEVNWESQSGNNKGFLGLADSTSLGTLQNAIGVWVAAGSFTGEYVTGGTVTSGTTVTGSYAQGAWLYGTMAYAGPTSTSYSAAESSSLYPGTMTTVNGHPLGSASTLYFAPMSHHTGTSAMTYYYNWARLRLYPPSNVAPSVSFGTLASNKFGVSIFITNSAGTVTTTVATNIQSPLLGATQTEYSMFMNAAQVSIPASGYISVVITAPTNACTIYWGPGQPTNFQVSYTYRSA